MSLKTQMRCKKMICVLEGKWKRFPSVFALFAVITEDILVANKNRRCQCRWLTKSKHALISKSYIWDYMFIDSVISFQVYYAIINVLIFLRSNWHTRHITVKLVIYLIVLSYRKNTKHALYMFSCFWRVRSPFP